MIVHFSVRVHPGGLRAFFLCECSWGRAKGDHSTISGPAPPRYDGRVSTNKFLFVPNVSAIYFTAYYRYH